MTNALLQVSQNGAYQLSLLCFGFPAFPCYRLNQIKTVFEALLEFATACVEPNAVSCTS